MPKNSLFLSIAIILFLTACQANQEEILRYEASIQQWRLDRVQDLTSGHSWLALAGLYRLQEGKNEFGSDPVNRLRFPDQAAPKMGTIYLDGDSVMLVARAEVAIMLNEQQVDFASMKATESAPTPVFHYQSLNWNLLERGGQYLIRLRDTLNPAIEAFDHIDYFDIASAWKLKTKFQPFDVPKKSSLKNILGMDIELEISGQLEFEVKGEPYALEVLDGGPEEFFIIFSDETTGVSTYGGGRYIYTKRPDEEGFTYIDFNKAYNPPCAFTDYATCLLPSQGNHLKLSITAGEKSYGAH